MKLQNQPGDTYWGLALAWYGQYMSGIGSSYTQKMNFLSKYGMKAMMGTPEEIDALNEKERESLFEELEKRDMHIILHANMDHMDRSDLSEVDRGAENEAKLLEKYVKPCRSDIVTTCAGSNHRYDRKWSWEERLERFSRALSPMTKLCWEMGSPFGIENHADYFVSDLIQVIRETPRLYLFLDTANALHIGENPVQACIEAAPYVIGTHFKDHAMVRGENPPLHYEITSCALGDGDACLEQQYRILMEKCPFRDKLVMLFELFSPETMSPVDCFEKSVDFVSRLQKQEDKQWRI